MNAAIRLPVEQAYAAELQALARNDDRQRPAGWSLSPKAVLTYLLGGKADDGTLITPKYVGRRRLMETAVATLATDRALLLLGVPGTAKSWVSEHLAAAIMGDSTLIVQCTAGTDENQIRYGWNYAQLLAKGPSQQALVPTPLYRAMQDGKLCRLEELTRMGSDVQDTLITVLSEKMMPIPELNTSIYAQRGFNIIATANNRDKGVNELSSALKRRFNVVVLPLPEDMAEEVAIVSKRVGEMAGGLDLPVPKNVGEEIARVLTIFRELRSGATSDGKVTLKTPSGSLSTAEAIATMVGGLSQAAWFDSGKLGAEGLAASLVGAIVKDPVQDKLVLEEYLETVLKKRPDYAGYYAALNAAI
ncbi:MULTISPECIES: ATP-binding protein [Mesorhizobium]|uniref:ATPase n=2 Tax=Mesorhizobium TaxID=68287 RepID=A0A1A5IRJ4_RHILI|nr:MULTISPECIES: AAA family ATPase [Mesorhizobium]ETA71748.1 MoxR-like ATPase [Mesorhizobium japonicum R7A]MBE1708586.1 AAA family ATPase [Mesorhizobium japonicum]MBE1713755.1 AAA family ATPase [Mesorhizobium japonicum]MUT19905.1 AAA domain-containing protein [Mesorhizobium japonicum]MUT25875.1 AAA domain-containing protein [Mesorhizobium japonicum]